MRLRLRMLPFLALAVFWATGALGQSAYKGEAIGAAGEDLPKALADALQPAGVRLASDQGATVCEVWVRKSVPTRDAPNTASDVLYGALSVGTLVGVAHFPAPGLDFRGQTIKPGYYTLRYAMIPQDGNHLGVSVYRDFLLLGPAAKDTDIEKQFSFEELGNLSRQASGTPHPAVLNLGAAKESSSVPSTFRDDRGHWVLQVQVSGKAGGGQEQTFPLAITLVGKAEA